MEKERPEFFITKDVIELIDSYEIGWIMLDKNNQLQLFSDGATGQIKDAKIVPSLLRKKMFKAEKLTTAHYRYWVKLTKLLFKDFNKSIITRINKEENYVFRGQLDEDDMAQIPPKVRQKIWGDT